ncbi:ParB/RepB/Spo0J family partition protein [Deinococcus sp. Leaf326]|uniref:ParB/RepB/Spo0J family partition protein n=1 Tax=Deinococcus sp. Leaf326 TaxID=1736338 RepID=UPI0006F871DC|nr:ParB/RepB/Spo0J family partition protein [Deinococcus sp. Leaf326]KQR37791.1 hypothetical protein ASF71_15020 [Deinococcus sp. Leaf326]
MTAAAAHDVALALTGWVKGSPDRQASDHWAVGGRALCGTAVPVGAQVISDRGVNPNAGAHLDRWVRACRACQSEVLRLAFNLPFRVGQRVVSRARGMTLRGVVVELFPDHSGQPLLNITRDRSRHPTPEDLEFGLLLTDWYRSPAECALLEDGMTATATKTPHKGSKKAAPSAAPAPAPAQASTKRPATFDLGPLGVGDYVTVRAKGTTLIGALLRHGDEAGTWHVLTRDGEGIVETSSLEGRDDYPPAVPLRVGDRVLIPISQRRHERYEVLQEVALNDAVPLRNLGDGEDHPGILASGVRVLTRTQIEDLYADLHLTKFLPAAAAPAVVESVDKKARKGGKKGAASAAVANADVQASEAVAWQPGQFVTVRVAELGAVCSGVVLAASGAGWWVRYRHPDGLTTLAGVAFDEDMTELHAWYAPRVGALVGTQEASPRRGVITTVGEGHQTTVKLRDGSELTLDAHAEDLQTYGYQDVDVACRMLGLSVPEEASAPAEAPELSKRTFEIPPFEAPTLGLQAIPWNKILPSTLNPRKKFDPAALRELAISIHAKGLQQNLVARPHPERHGMYELAAGERRYRAIALLTAGLAGEGDVWLEVPQDFPVNVLVQDLDDLALLEVATSENVHRNDFSPLEEADAYAALMDHGATVDGLHDRFGLGKRTIRRRVQIARHLIPALRELYESKKLALNQAEVLALATPSVQAGLLKSHLRYSAQTSPADLRKLISERVFLVSRAQFPRAWYKGKTVSADLFGELAEHFADFDEALGCQVRHAVALARKDVEKGALCAEVREGPELQLYKYIDSPDGGPVYWVNSTTGDLKRYENKRLRTGYEPSEYYFERAKAVSPHETPAPALAPASAPSTPASTPEAPKKYEAVSPAQATVPTRDYPTYPDPYLVSRWGTDQALLQAAATPQFLHALVILDALDDGWSFPIPARAACRVLAEASGGALVLNAQEDLALPEDPSDMDVPEIQAQLRAALQALEAAPADALATVFTFRVIEGLRPSLNEETRDLLVERQPFVLTESYLKACNHEALLEMWTSAGLPEEPNAGDEYFRAMLLEEAPALAARGWLPLPLVRDAAARSAYEIPFDGLYEAAGNLIDKLTLPQLVTVIASMDADEAREASPEAARHALHDVLGQMETDHIRTWTALWQFHTPEVA